MTSSYKLPQQIDLQESKQETICTVYILYVLTQNQYSQETKFSVKESVFFPLRLGDVSKVDLF